MKYKKQVKVKFKKHTSRKKRKVIDAVLRTAINTETVLKILRDAAVETVLYGPAFVPTGTDNAWFNLETIDWDYYSTCPEEEEYLQAAQHLLQTPKDQSAHQDNHHPDPKDAPSETLPSEGLEPPGQP